MKAQLDVTDIRCPRCVFQLSRKPKYCTLSPVGLKAWTFSPKEVPPSSPGVAASPSYIMTANITFPPNGDYIGTESCIDLQNDNDSNYGSTTNIGCSNLAHGKKQELRSSDPKKKQLETREFPPPMPLLARTQNLPSHMPWVLKRYVTSDGRLILKEEKVRHHEYFRAHRANGRLTLQLVLLDDDVLDSLPPFADQNYEFLETTEVEGGASNETMEEINDIDQKVNPFSDEDSDVGDEVAKENEKGVASANGTSQCLNSIRVGSSSCIFEVPVHPIRAVLAD